MKKKHTPGPWRVFGPMRTTNSSKFFCVGSKRETICETQQKANARLIAAAPKMLEALEKIDELLLNHPKSVPHSWWIQLKCEVVNAIKKAEGSK